MGTERRLDRLHIRSPRIGSSELRPKFAEISKPLFAIDQIRIGDSVGSTREEIGQSHLVTHIPRQHVEGQVKRPGNLLEDAVKEFVSCGVDRRGATFLSDFQCAFHAFLLVAWEEQQFLVAIEGIGAGFCGRELYGDGSARPHISLDRQPCVATF